MKVDYSVSLFVYRSGCNVCRAIWHAEPAVVHRAGTEYFRWSFFAGFPLFAGVEFFEFFVSSFGIIVDYSRGGFGNFGPVEALVWLQN